MPSTIDVQRQEIAGIAERPAIYLHSTWRSASTYLWAKFRHRPEHYAYFEPLNEHLAGADPDFIARFSPWSFANHPVLTQPYLAEFLPLLAAGGGVENYPAALTFGHYRADPSMPLPGLNGYFDRLEWFARALGRAPVFGCVRTDLRVGWFCANRPGVHIVLRRDPRRQFLSCLAQAAKGNPYFLQRGLVILASNPDDPALAPLGRRVDLKAVEEALRHSSTLTEVPALSDLYMIAYALHRLAAAEARHAHLTLDMDLVSGDPDAARAAEAAVLELTSTRISFKDCRIERYDRQVERTAGLFAELEAKVDAMMSACWQAA